MTEIYISPTFELYECMVCNNRFKLEVGNSLIDNPKVKIITQLRNFGPLNGCCTIGSLREIKENEEVKES